MRTSTRRQKRNQDDTRHHDRWMVSYADLITLLFAFFVVLYASSSVNSTKYEQLKVSMGAAFNTQLDTLKKDASKSAVAVATGQADPAAQATASLLISAETPQDPQQIIIALTAQLDKLTEEQKALKISIDQTQGDKAKLQLTLSDLETERQNLHVTIDKMRNRLSHSMDLNRILSGANNDRGQLLQDMRQSLDSQGVQVEIDMRNGILRLPEALLFDSGRAEFTPQGVKALKILAENLMGFLPCYAYVNDVAATSSRSCDNLTNGKQNRLEAVMIEGHTDNVKISTAMFRDNWDLSVARARNTYTELVKIQPKLENLENNRGQPLVSFSAYAGRRPIAENNLEADRRKNRRIDLRFIMSSPEIATDEKSLENAINGD